MFTDELRETLSAVRAGEEFGSLIVPNCAIRQSRRGWCG